MEENRISANVALVAALAKKSGGGGGSITVDSQMSTASTNPLQNKVVTQEISNLKNKVYIAKNSEKDSFVTSEPTEGLVIGTTFNTVVLSQATGVDSVAFPGDNLASGHQSIVGGLDCTAAGHQSFVFGDTNISGDIEDEGAGYCAVAFGRQTTALGDYSLVEGFRNKTEGTYSHAEGVGNQTAASGQHVEGRYNIASNTYLHIAGNGTNASNRSNAYTLDWNGNGTYAGKVTVGSQPTNDFDVATKKYVDDSHNEIYSTTRQKVGTWIDGSDIYKETLSYTNITITNNATMISSEPLPEKINLIKAEGLDSDYNILPFSDPLAGSATTNEKMYFNVQVSTASVQEPFVSRQIVTIGNNSGSDITKDFYITIWYTISST